MRPLQGFFGGAFVGRLVLNEFKIAKRINHSGAHVVAEQFSAGTNQIQIRSR